MQRCLFLIANTIKPSKKYKSLKVMAPKPKKTQKTTQQKKTRSSALKEEPSETNKDVSTDKTVEIKKETVTPTDTVEEKPSTKTNFSQFEFKREAKPVLTGSSSKKRQHVKIEYEEITQSEIKNEEEDKDASKKIKTEDEKPLHWETVLNNLREMRKNRDAPVDSMGYHKGPDENATPEVRRYQALITLMLSSQTKDQVTHAAIIRLKEHGCTVENILNTTDEKLGELIYPVGFWKSKVKYIKKTTEILKNEYNSDIPNTAENLCKLPGVGPKMAYLCMQNAWNEVTGIGVDTHVHRICNRLGWVKAKNPEATRKQLENWLPQKLWQEVNLLLVGFGQQICMATNPQCANCLNREICPFGVKNVKAPGKKSKSK